MNDNPNLILLASKHKYHTECKHHTMDANSTEVWVLSKHWIGQIVGRNHLSVIDEPLGVLVRIHFNSEVRNKPIGTFLVHFFPGRITRKPERPVFEKRPAAAPAARRWLAPQSYQAGYRVRILNRRVLSLAQTQNLFADHATAQPLPGIRRETRPPSATQLSKNKPSPPGAQRGARFDALRVGVQEGRATFESIKFITVTVRRTTDTFKVYKFKACVKLPNRKIYTSILRSNGRGEFLCKHDLRGALFTFTCKIRSSPLSLVSNLREFYGELNEPAQSKSSPPSNGRSQSELYCKSL